MGTLLENWCRGKRWYPQRIETYECALKLRGTIKNKTLIRKNFAYNMQYIEYIEKQLTELNLSSVLEKMLYKSFIITGMGIIESLFLNLLKATGNRKLK